MKIEHPQYGTKERKCWTEIQVEHTYSCEYEYLKIQKPSTPLDYVFHI